MFCTAVRHKKAGPCTHYKFKDDLCKLHYNSMLRKGTKQWTLDQMYMRQTNTYNTLLALSMKGEDVQEHMDIMKIQHRYERYRLTTMMEMVPDNQDDMYYTIRMEDKRAKRQIALEELWMNRRQALMQNVHQEVMYEMDHADIQPIPEFHADPQNIHRAETVNEVVKKTIQKVITIPVPEDHVWNMTAISKTPGEIIAECKLSIPAGKLLIDKYTSEETIYDMIPGIYGKTLDSVWQFVKGHEDKSLLIKTLKTELEDNIGMCAQGNLSRLCNVLQGYVDGLTIPPISEILGDLLPPLMEIESETERREKAMQIMRTHNVPDDQQDAWLEGLVW